MKKRKWKSLTDMRNLLLFFVIIMMVELSYAGEIKMRAREHFDFHNIDFSDGSNVFYSGLSNTINVWWEKPRIYSVGLAFNPILGSASSNNEVDVRLGDKIKLVTLGVESKYYHRYIANQLFSRIGLGATRLQTDGNRGDLSGFHTYVGMGWEFDVKGIGFALEIAYRQSWLAQDIVVKSVTPSVGVHFYP